MPMVRSGWPGQGLTTLFSIVTFIPRRIRYPSSCSGRLRSFKRKSVAARYRTNVLNADIGQRSHGAAENTSTMNIRVTNCEIDIPIVTALDC